MIRASHTPGPWFVDDDGELFVCPADAEAPIIATLVEQGDAEEPHLHGSEWYNAHLIAAAPEMLEALIMALPYVEVQDGDEHYKPGAVAKTLKVMRAVIAKATGGE